MQPWSRATMAVSVTYWTDAQLPVSTGNNNTSINPQANSPPNPLCMVLGIFPKS